MELPKLKICGVNDAAFAAEAERCGANYIGVIFADGRPRRVTPAQAKEIVQSLRGAARAVGVFTTTPVAEVVQIAGEVGLGIVQLHRKAAAADVKALKDHGLEVWALAGGADADAMLFDSSHGDGERSLRKGPWLSVLAGGISSGNVEEAVRSGADVIDASGSLESSPGVKSIALLHEFIDAFRRISNPSAPANSPTSLNAE